MNCPNCGAGVYDNRAEKAAGIKDATWADFACKNKCGWRVPPKQGTVPSPQTAPVHPVAPASAPTGDRVALFWDSLDQVMQGLAVRKLTDYFKPEDICRLTATLYIGRSR